jgi:hypothetical protein
MCRDGKRRILQTHDETTDGDLNDTALAHADWQRFLFFEPSRLQSVMPVYAPARIIAGLGAIGTRASITTIAAANFLLGSVKRQGPRPMREYEVSVVMLGWSTEETLRI